MLISCSVSCGVRRRSTAIKNLELLGRGEMLEELRALLMYITGWCLSARLLGKWVGL